MIGARSLHDSQWGAWNLVEDRSLLSIYGDKRMQRNKHDHRTGSDVEQGRLTVDPDADFRIKLTDDHHEAKSRPPPRRQLKEGGKFRKEDPRHVAVSWYRYFYLRPDSPTQWEQRDDMDTEPDHFRIMGFESDPDARRDHQPPVRSDMSVLEKLSKMAEQGEPSEPADLEVEGFFEERQHLISKFDNGSISKPSGLLTETGELLF